MGVVPESSRWTRDLGDLPIAGLEDMARDAINLFSAAVDRPSRGMMSWEDKETVERAHREGRHVIWGPTSKYWREQDYLDPTTGDLLDNPWDRFRDEWHEYPQGDFLVELDDVPWNLTETADTSVEESTINLLNSIFGSHIESFDEFMPTHVHTDNDATTRITHTENPDWGGNVPSGRGTVNHQGTISRNDMLYGGAGADHTVVAHGGSGGGYDTSSGAHVMDYQP
jgi:hypothetical protein